MVVATIKNWRLHRLHVRNAFLHRDLNVEVHMKISPSFGGKGEHRVCRLQKSLYVLRQASRQWFSKLSSALVSFRSSSSQSNHSLFTRVTDSSFTALFVYVDDIIVASNDLQYVDSIKIFLDDQFQIKNLGPLKFFSWFEIAKLVSH